MSTAARHWIMLLALPLSALLGVAAFEAVSPIGMLQRGLIFGAGRASLAVAAIFVLDVFALRQGWCGTLCPLGAFYSLVGRFSLVRIGFDSFALRSLRRLRAGVPRAAGDSLRRDGHEGIHRRRPVPELRALSGGLPTGGVLLCNAIGVRVRAA